MYIAFGGAVTFRNARKQREIAAKIPEDRLLAETDSPYIGTDKVRPPFVRPAQVMETAAAYSEITGLSLEDTEKLTEANSERFFGFAKTGTERQS